MNWRYLYQKPLNLAQDIVSEPIGQHVEIVELTSAHMTQWNKAHASTQARHNTNFDWQGIYNHLQTDNPNGQSALIAFLIQGQVCALSHFTISPMRETFAMMRTQAVPHSHALKGWVRYAALQTAAVCAVRLNCAKLLDVGPYYNPTGPDQCRHLGFQEYPIDNAGFSDSDVLQSHFCLTLQAGTIPKFNPDIFKKPALLPV